MARLREGGLPPRGLELVLPPVEAGARLVSGLHHLGQRAIPAGQPPLQQAHGHVVQPQAQPAATRMLPQQGLAALELRRRQHGAPLHGGVGFGNEGVYRTGHAGGPAGRGSARRLAHPLGQLEDRDHVLVSLAGQADHEIQLEVVPAPGGDLPGGVEQPRLGDPFVDPVAQPLGPRFRCEGEAARPTGAQVVEQRAVEPDGPQRRDAHGHRARAELRRGAPQQGAQLRVVGRGQGRERDLVVAPLLGAPFEGGEHGRQGALAQGTVQEPGLTEPAALVAAARDLDGGAIEDRLDGGHGAAAGVGEGSQVRLPAADGSGRLRRPDHPAFALGVPGRLALLGRVQLGALGQGGDPVGPRRAPVPQVSLLA